MTESAHLLTNPFPAVFALNRLFDDRIARNPIINAGDHIQRETNTNKINAFVKERAAIAVRTSTLRHITKGLPVSHDHGTIIKSHLHSVISFTIMRAPSQDSELLLHVAIDEWQQ